MNHIGNNLKFLLKEQRLSENEFSKRLGISQQIINRIITGINQNPKLSTIIPIADYFNIPLHDLISKPITEILTQSSSLTSHKIPYIEFRDLMQAGIEQALSLTERYISVDLDKKNSYFATSMYDDSMEPKFSKGTVLVFKKSKDALSGDFCLLKGDDNHYMFRQIMLNSIDKKFIKCLNPTGEECSVIPLPINFYILATLLESRNVFGA